MNQSVALPGCREWQHLGSHCLSFMSAYRRNFFALGSPRMLFMYQEMDHIWNRLLKKFWYCLKGIFLMRVISYKYTQLLTSGVVWGSMTHLTCLHNWTVWYKLESKQIREKKERS